MAGWSKEKRERVEAAFYTFLNRCWINSKDEGRICLGEHLYYGQVLFITAVFDALEAGIHKLFVLKSRQLGISTIARAFSAFYLGIHNGLKGALVFDTGPHRESARTELVTLINNLPASLRFPRVQGSTGRGNRDSLALSNESQMLFMAAGVKKSKSSGTLGRSEGLTFAHLSELCSYDNPEGLKSFEQSLSELHPDRFYIYESTARGFNQWYEMWRRARKDETHCKSLFLGWWSKPSQRIDRTDIDWIKYGEPVPTEHEAEKIGAVKAQYGYDVTPEQLAWIRRKMDPLADDDESLGDSEEDSVMLAEQAWTEEEAFQQTGAVFFGSKQLTDQSNRFVRQKRNTYWYSAGDDFAEMRIYPAQNRASTQLKVWDEPEQDATYVMGIDPAFGENENNARSSIQICRCYADGIDQVAEYAWPLITTRQFAWVVVSLLGWYGQGNSEIRYILELNGPGSAVFNEMRSLRFQIDNDRRLRQDLSERGLADVFKNVRTYIYQRPDAMGVGYNWHWVTNLRLKILIMERLRDFVSTGKFRIRSSSLIEEMQTIAREGDSIGAPEGMKDDRVIAAALSAYYWDTKIKNLLLTQNRTREAEAARKAASVVDQVALFNKNHLDIFFGQKRLDRVAQQRMAIRTGWRNPAARPAWRQ